jgi:8-oxo-dGTP pyrophosphatase MutT (NUDIX family)
MPMSDYVRDLRAKIGTDLMMMPASGGIIINDNNEVLLQLRSDTLTWGIPGGALDPGEEIADCAVREIYEETALHVIPERITSVLAGEDFFHVYPDGNQVAIISVMFRCRPIGGVAKVNDDESLEVRYFPVDALPDGIIPRHRLMIEKGIENHPIAFFRRGKELDINNLPEVNYFSRMRPKVGHDVMMSPGATGIVLNDKNEILLQLRRDLNVWGLPGGGMEPGEEPAEGVVREVYEETGVIVQPERIIAVLAGRDHLVTYQNDDQVAVVAIVFLCRPIKGEAKVNDGESLDVRYFPLNELPNNMLDRHRFRIEKSLENNPSVFFRYNNTH